LTDPEQVADLVSCAVLAGPVERQTILETANLETRLKHLIHFLMAEIRRRGKDKGQ
jgi:ATP-dependent Lon protease